MSFLTFTKLKRSEENRMDFKESLSHTALTCLAVCSLPPIAGISALPPRPQNYSSIRVYELKLSALFGFLRLIQAMLALFPPPFPASLSLVTFKVKHTGSCLK